VICNIYKEDKLRREEESKLKGNIKGSYIALKAKPDSDERFILKS
jgi:predicted small secreted protein